MATSSANTASAAPQPPGQPDLLARIRRADPDRFFCSLFAPQPHRASLWLLYAFNHELARAREVASEPSLALIRLAWWREVVEGVAKHHEIATPLGQALRADLFSRTDLLGLIAAREIEAAPEMPDFEHFMIYVRGTAGALSRIAGKVLGADSDEVAHLGTAYGISGILRAAPFLAQQNRSLLPADGTPETRLIETARLLLECRPPRIALAAALPAVYARRNLSKPTRPRGLGDRVAIIRAAFTGRI